MTMFASVEYEDGSIAEAVWAECEWKATPKHPRVSIKGLLTPDESLFFERIGLKEPPPPDQLALW